MTDFATHFGQRQDKMKHLYVEDEIAPKRPLGNVDMVQSILMDLHHRLAFLNQVMVGEEERSIEASWEAVKELAEYEWSLIGPTVIEKARAKQNG